MEFVKIIIVLSALKLKLESTNKLQNIDSQDNMECILNRTKRLRKIYANYRLH